MRELKGNGLQIQAVCSSYTALLLPLLEAEYGVSCTWSSPAENSCGLLVHSFVPGKYSQLYISNACQPESILFQIDTLCNWFCFLKTNNGLFLIKALKIKPVADNPTNVVVSLYQAASLFSVIVMLCRRVWVLQLLQQTPDSPLDNQGCQAVGRLKDGTLNTQVQEMDHTIFQLFLLYQ